MWKLKQIKLFNIFGLLLLFVSSCTSVTFKEGDVELQNFTLQQETDIIQILKDLKVYEKHGFTFRKTNLPPEILGRAASFPFECFVELSPRIFTNSWFKIVLYHEIGHCMGLSHSPNPRDIMFEECRDEKDYNQADYNRYFQQLNSCF